MTGFPRAVDRPRELPELRSAMLELAREQGPIYRGEFERTLYENTGDTPVAQVSTAELSRAYEAGRVTARWYRENLSDAQLVWVSPEMARYVREVADSVPVGLTLTMDDAPARQMLVVLAEPYYGTDSIRPDTTVRVDGLLIGPSRLPPRIGHLDMPLTDCITVALWRMVEPSQADALAAGVRQVMWLPLGRMDWPVGDQLGERTLPDIDDLSWSSMMEDRRYLVALWSVLNQKLLTERELVMPDRAMRKRLVRAGGAARDDTVHVVHLRRREYTTSPPGTSGRHVNVRYRVRQHWRRQAVGPGRSERRLTLIPAHWRGPDDAPLSEHSTVWSLDT